MWTVVRVITRLNTGGPAQHAILLAAHLNREEFASSLVTGVVGPEEGDMTPLAAVHGVTPIVVPTLRNRVNPVRDALTILLLYRLFRRMRPAIVHLHLFKARALGTVAARLAGVPVLVETFHGTVLSHYYGPVVTRILVAVERWIARSMAGVLVVSRQIAAEIEQLGIARPNQITVVPLGLELERFVEASEGPGILRQELRIPGETPVIGMVGRLVPIKGGQYFVDAAADVVRILPKTMCVIIGDGTERPKLEQLVIARGLAGQVRFLGWRRDLEQIYPDLDVIVLSSLHEGTPAAIIEAMAAGRAVVATRVGGVPDVIDDGRTGILVPPRDAQAIARAVVSLLQDPARRRSLGEEAQRAVYPRFAVSRLVEEMREFYIRLLRQRGIAMGATGQ